MPKYLVTGGCGFIGSHLVERLLRDGHDVTVLDDLSTGSKSNIPARVPVRVGTVADASIVAAMIAHVDGCFHLAAVASVERATRDWLGTHQTNLAGTITILDAARRRSGRPVPVVYASSAAVYGDNANVPLREDARTRPLSAYGADKLGCELHAAIASIAYGVPATGFRFFNVYGPRQDPKSPYSGVISIFAQRILAGRPITIHGDGQQVRDFVYVTDVVDSLVAGMRQATTRGSVYNVCSGQPTSVNELARMLGALSGTKPEIGHGPPRVGDIRTSLGDPSNIAEELGVRCATTLDDGLRHTLAWISQAMAGRDTQEPVRRGLRAAV